MSSEPTPAAAANPGAPSDPDSTIGTLQAVGHHHRSTLLPPPADRRNSSLSVSSLSDNSADGHMLPLVVRGSTMRSALARAQGEPRHGDDSSYSRWGEGDVFDQDRAQTTGRRRRRSEELAANSPPLAAAAAAVAEDSTSASIGAASLQTNRHLEIWERFFKNAILVTASDSADSAAVNRQMELSKRIATIRQTSSASRSKGATSTARWPSQLSPPRYSSAMALVLQQDLRAADPTPAAAAGSYVDDEENKETELIEAVKGIVSSGARNHRCVLQCIDRSSASSLALLLTALHGDVRAAEELLLRRGADPNCLDDQLRTPTHYCSKMGSVSLLALLFDNGADLEGNMMMTSVSPDHHYHHQPHLLLLYLSSLSPRRSRSDAAAHR